MGGTAVLPHHLPPYTVPPILQARWEQDLPPRIRKFVAGRLNR